MGMPEVANTGWPFGIEKKPMTIGEVCILITGIVGITVYVVTGNVKTDASMTSQKLAEDSQKAMEVRLTGQISDLKVTVQNMPTIVFTLAQLEKHENGIDSRVEEQGKHQTTIDQNQVETRLKLDNLTDT